MRALLVILTILTFGCAAATDDFDVSMPRRDFGLYVEIEMFTDTQLLLLYEASVEWSRLTDGRARIEWLAEHPGPEDDGNGTASWVLPERSHCDPLMLGCAFYAPPEKVVEFIDHGGEPWPDELFYAVALHELGHYLGEWEHSEDPADIMYANMVGQDHLTANDVRMWCELTQSDSPACNVFR